MVGSVFMLKLSDGCDVEAESPGAAPPRTTSARAGSSGGEYCKGAVNCCRSAVRTAGIWGVCLRLPMRDRVGRPRLSGQKCQLHWGLNVLNVKDVEGPETVDIVAGRR